ncbi:nonribosomal peptide synthetase fmqA [Aspergillus novofumigatus IBT 16806]|uniref:Putative nonribosomal peptide synthase n=1 Tax=Aspergillus novofumigatus (strain IBT 16806) TaxID=1392255 RepID=A0A2I1BW90_ASPN1|nr:putative nonribosomal peptide synthase [Aspergillus novofumigatus IBT 16806]PKX89648.1 putative nonribosomal peptide synthase [Aspergillus novofumigatus IBT 16806]
MAHSWDQTLSNADCLFPTVRATKGQRAEWASEQISPALVRESVQFCQKANVQLSLLLATAWAVILRRYAEVDQVQIGQQRLTHTEEASAKMGCKLQMMLMSTSMANVVSVRELFDPGRWAMSAPNPETLHAFNSGMIICEGDIKQIDTSKELESGEEPQVYVAYKMPMVAPEQAEHVSTTFTQVVSVILQDSEIAPGHISLVSQAQMARITEWNGRKFTQPTVPFLHQIIRKHSFFKPNQPAIEAWDGSLTYNELDEAAGRLAAQLVGRGICPGHLVPVCFEKSLWAVVAMLAINKTGAAFVPLDPSQPRNRLQNIARQLTSPLGLASADHRDTLGEAIPSVLEVSDETQVSQPAPPHHEPDILITAEAHGAAYCLFTSGSTGEPKGCVVDHTALASITSHSAGLHLSPSSRVLQFASFSFGVSLIEVWCTLASGGTVCIPSASDRINHLAKIIRTMRINWTILTPTTLGTLHPKEVPSLKTIIVAGEPLKQSQILQWMEAVNLYQGYGFTEWAGICCVSPRIESTVDTGLIGKPVNANSWLVDPEDSDSLAAIGAAAELVVEGPSLALGYLNDDAKTNTRFIENPPWLPVSKESKDRRFYRTGDLVRYDSGGTLRFLGRKDRQVKIRGQRVELGEIESQIDHAYPEYRNSIVEGVVPVNGDGNRVLVAFIPSANLKTFAPGSNTGDESLLSPLDKKMHADVVINRLEAELPDYMVPQIFVSLDKMPLTITGKIDRNKLRAVVEQLRPTEWDRLLGLTTDDRQLPSTRSERLIHKLVTQVLGLSAEIVGMQHGFCALGGDSVLAMKLVGLARHQNLQLSVQHILRSSSLVEMATQMEDLNECLQAEITPPPFSLLNAGMLDTLTTLAAERCRVKPERIEDIYPCTPLQEGMMALAARRPGAYVARFVYRASPSTDPDRLRSAWEMAVAANPILRTRIIRRASAGTIATTSNGHTLEKRVDGSLHLILNMHHAVCDRWSSLLIHRQVEDAYKGKELALTPFSPFVRYLCTCTNDRAKEYWTSELAGLEGDQFPSLPSESYVPNPAQTMEQLIQYRDAIPRGYTLSSILRLTWALVLARYTSSKDLVFGVTVTGRAAPLSGVEEMTGPAIATVPVRVQLYEKDTNLDVLQRIQNQTIGMIPFEQTGLQYIRHYSRDCMHACSFRSHFTVQPAWPENMQDDGETILTMCSAGPAIPHGFSSYALNVMCQLAETQEIRVSVDFDTEVVSAFQMKHILAHFEHLLQYILACPDQLVDAISRLSPLDMVQLRQWNGSVPPSEAACVHDLIQRHVVNAPDSPAIHAWDGSLTYAQLNALSNRLATELIADGVGPNVFVPLCFEKTFWTTVAMLGVMKAGGAFILLDPSQPVQRLKTLCQRAGCTLALASAEKQSIAAELVPNIRVLDQKHNGSVARTSVGKFADGRAQPNCALYVVFTSGTTGVPKGVVVEHRSYCTAALAHNVCFQINNRSRVLQVASYAFDASVLETLSTLIAGGCVCILSEEQRQNALAETAAGIHPTHTYLTPSLARLIIAQTQSEKTTFTGTLISVGEPMTKSDVRQWAAKPWKLMNGYGPAECSAITTVQDTVNCESDPHNIGIPRGGRCWLVDPNDHQRLVPVGAVGEVLIEGPIVGRGYLNDPERTSAAFIQSPSWLANFDRVEESSSRLYKTGDLAQYASDGSLLFLGRKDTQVKLRGQRLELGEVESQLRQCFPGLIDAVVEMFKSSSRSYLVAFLLTSPSPQDAADGELLAEPTPEFQAMVAATRNRLQQVLPDFMVPDVYVPMRELPLNAAGKTDRRRLRDLASQHSWDQLVTSCRHVREKRKPQTQMECDLQRIWAHVLNRSLDSVGADDSFYELGGDSITAMHVVSQARNEGIIMSVEQIVRYNNLSEIAQHCRSMERLEGDGDDDDDDDDDRLFALSPMQQMFFETQRNDWDHYCRRFLVRVTEPIKFASLEAAVLALVRKHPMLRVRFARQLNGVWQQSITSTIESSFRCDTHTLTARASLQEVVWRSARRINIQHGPLLCVDLINVTEDGSQRLCLVAHHLVVDSVSCRILLGDLESALRLGLIPGSSHTLPLREWNLRQMRLLSDRLSEHVPPSVTPPLEMASSYNHDAAESWGISEQLNIFKHTVCQTFKLDPHSTKRLLGPANVAFNTQPPDLLLAALLYSWGSAFPGRPLPQVFNEIDARVSGDPQVDMSQTVGCFSSLAPLVLGTDEVAEKAEALLDIVRRVKDARAALTVNGRAYFASHLLHPLGQTDLRCSHPVEITFQYVGAFEQLERSDAMFQSDDLYNLGALVAGDSITRIALFDIAVSVVRGYIHVRITYNRYMKSQEDIQAWIKRYQRALSQISEVLIGLERKYTLSDFPLLRLTYDQLDKMIHQVLPQRTISVNAIDDIYPCSPSQRGILVARTKGHSNYEVDVTWRIETRDAASIELDRFKSAWQRVVARHPILRTIFIPSLSQESYMDQLVLKDPSPVIIYRKQAGTSSIKSLIDEHEELMSRNLELCHKLALGNGKKDNEMVCCLRINHAIMDSVTIGIIQQDLGLAYDDNLPRGQAPRYRDYVAYLQQQDTGPAMEYWGSYLADAEPCHFPRINSITKQASDERGSSVLVFNRVFALREFCRTNNITLWHVLCLAWALVMRAYTNSDQVCFGYAKSARDFPSRALRILRTAETTTRLSRGASASVLSAVKYPSTCGEHRPVQYVCRYQFPAGHTASPGQPDFTVFQGLDTRTGLMAKDQAASVIGAVEKAISGIITNPDARLGAIDILSDHDWEAMWKINCDIPTGIESCVHEVIHQRCREHPDKVAVHAWDRCFTYRQLDTLSSRLVPALQRRGVGPEVIVPLYFERSSWTPVAILAVMKAGGAFILLDPSHPHQYLKKICDEVRCRLILCSPMYVDACCQLSPSIFVVSGDTIPKDDDRMAISASRVGPHNAVYVVFTSGSTGEPKGIVIEHRQYVSGAKYHLPGYNIEPWTRILQFSSYAFDPSVQEHISTLMVGACVCIPSETQRLNDLVGAIRDLQVNYAIMVPSLARRLRREEVTGLKTLTLVGESMTQADVEYWAGSVRLVNGYGPAECSVVSVIQSGMSVDSNPHDIGVAQGCVCWVVDPDNHDLLLPMGAIGELLIEGPLVGRGYLNNPRKTAEAFITPPKWLQPLRASHSSRLYMTGDLVRFNGDGSFQYLGRKDKQVKIRGQRIELAHVEAQVRQCFEGALDAVVELAAMAGSTSRRAQLVALVVNAQRPKDKKERGNCLLQKPSDDFCTSAAAATIALRQALPSSMVPSIILPLVEIPRTASGKVDRNSLRTRLEAMSPKELEQYRPAVSSSSNQDGLAGPEKVLLQLCAEVLGLGPGMLGVNDNFFHIGGDSIDAMKLAAISRATGFVVSVADIFAHPVLADLASVAVSFSSADEQPYHPFSLAGRIQNPRESFKKHQRRCSNLSHAVLVDVLPVTPTQQVFIDRKTFHSYHFALKGRINVDRLRQACDTMMARFPCSGGPRQRPGPFHHRWAEMDPLAQCRSQWEVEMAKFDIRDGLAVTWTLFSSSPVDHVFALQLSHAQWDGVSIPYLFQDLAAAYNNMPLPPTSDFTLYLHRCATLDRTAPHQFWREYLRGSSLVTPFPLVHTRSTDQLTTTVMAATSIQLPSLPAGFTMATLIKAAAAFYLARLLVRMDIVFGQTVNGRNMTLDNVDIILGPCLNFIPIRVTLRLAWTVKDLLAHVYQQHTLSLPYDYIPLPEIVQECTEWPAESELRFIVQHQNIQLEQKLPLEGITDVKYSLFANFDPLKEVWVFSEPHSDRLEIQVCSNSSVLTQTQAQFLSEEIAKVVMVFSRTPDMLLDRVLEHVCPHMLLPN